MLFDAPVAPPSTRSVVAVIIRPATGADLDGYLAIQNAEWGPTMAASRPQLESRRAVFPAGQLVGVVDGRVVAAASFLRLPGYDLAAGLSWDDLTDRGWCTNHDPAGPILFGVDLTVSRRAPRAAAVRLFVAAVELTVRLGVTATYWGSRMPRYHRWAGVMSPEEYLRARTPRGRYLDPEIEIYSRIPGLEILGVVPDYFKDWESGDNGAIVRWTNPVHRHPYLRPFASRLAHRLYARPTRRPRRPWPLAP